jgi:hypothetical protein
MLQEPPVPPCIPDEDTLSTPITLASRNARADEDDDGFIVKECDPFGEVVASGT